jgi:hypothetical protein
MKIHSPLLLPFLIAGLQACENIGPLGNPFNSVPRTNQQASIGAEALRDCPTPRGVFQNTSETGQSSPGLERYFSVPGFQMDPRHVAGADPVGGAVSVSMSALHLLGGVENGIRRPYQTRSGERITLEIRPLTTPGWFRISVRSSLGGQATGDGRFVLSRSADGLSGRRCEDGALNSYARLASGKVERYESLWVDPATGDVLMAYRADLDRGKATYRYRRLAD